MSFGFSDHSVSAIDTVSASSSSSPGDRRIMVTELSISDLRLVQRLGSGDIGSVYLAELKKGGGAGAEGSAVAAKVMDKEELEGMNKERRARMEREILEVLDHPFLPRLLGAAEDERWSCHLTEFCPGGDLHVLRQRQPGRRFGEAAVRFYAAEVVVALEYMHMMGIIYRDLKPENVLVRSDGHIVITDFDLSLKCKGEITPAQLVTYRHPLVVTPPTVNERHSFSTASRMLPNCMLPVVSCFQPKSTSRHRKKPIGLEFVAEPVDLRSMSFVGTHEYLAPEIVSGEGHGSTVDWWTLGVFIYEMLYGVTPFRGADNEATLGNIVARPLEFPKEPAVPLVLRDLVAGLLVKDPTKRLGSTMGAAAIKRHSFFKDVNWALLRCTTPPFVPPPYTSSCNTSRDMSDESCPGTCPGTPVEYY